MLQKFLYETVVILILKKPSHKQLNRARGSTQNYLKRVFEIPGVDNIAASRNGTSHAYQFSF